MTYCTLPSPLLCSCFWMKSRASTRKSLGDLEASGSQRAFFSGKRREHKPKLFFRISASGDVKGWVSKSSVCPLKPRKTKLFGRISWDFGWDVPGVTAKFETKSLCPILAPYLPRSLSTENVGAKGKTLGPQGAIVDLHMLSAQGSRDGAGTTPGTDHWDAADFVRILSDSRQSVEEKSAENLRNNLLIASAPQSAHRTPKICSQNTFAHKSAHRNQRKNHTKNRCEKLISLEDEKPDKQIGAKLVQNPSPKGGFGIF